MGEVNLDSKGVVVKCRSCGQRNRIAYSATAQENRCGQCKSILRLPNAPIDICSDGEFNALTAQSELPVLVDFWAPWCAPCRSMGPALEQVASANAGSFLVAKANTEELPNVAIAFEVRSIPALAVFHKGQTLARTEGARPAADIQRFVNNAIAGLQASGR